MVQGRAWEPRRICAQEFYRRPVSRVSIPSACCDGPTHIHPLYFFSRRQNHPRTPRMLSKKVSSGEGTVPLKAGVRGWFAFHCVLFWILYHVHVSPILSLWTKIFYNCSHRISKNSSVDASRAAASRHCSIISQPAFHPNQDPKSL